MYALLVTVVPALSLPQPNKEPSHGIKEVSDSIRQTNYNKVHSVVLRLESDISVGPQGNVDYSVKEEIDSSPDGKIKDTLPQTGTFKDHSVVLRLESDIAIGPHRNVPNSPDKEGSSDFRNNKTDDSPAKRKKRWVKVVGTGAKMVYRGTRTGVKAVYRGTKAGLKKTWNGIKWFGDKTDKYMWPLLFLEIPGDTRLSDEELARMNGDYDEEEK